MGLPLFVGQGLSVVFWQAVLAQACGRRKAGPPRDASQWLLFPDVPNALPEWGYTQSMLA